VDVPNHVVSALVPEGISQGCAMPGPPCARLSAGVEEGRESL
jgi:hypothetical protein